MEIFRSGHLAAPEFNEFLSSCLPQWWPLLSEQIRLRVEPAESMSATEYLAMRRELAQLSASAAQRLQQVDALVTPTVPITPPTVAAVSTLEGYREHNLMALRNTCPANLLSLCALTMPVGLDGEGMPVGMQLLAPRGRDEALLAMAYALECRLGSASERIGKPPVNWTS